MVTLLQHNTQKTLNFRLRKSLHFELSGGRQPTKCERVPNVDVFYFDMTFDVIGDHEVNKIKVSFDKFGRAIKCRLNFENRPSSFGDRKGLWIDLPPPLQWTVG